MPEPGVMQRSPQRNTELEMDLCNFVPHSKLHPSVEKKDRVNTKVKPLPHPTNFFKYQPVICSL